MPILLPVAAAAIAVPLLRDASAGPKHAPNDALPGVDRDGSAAGATDRGGLGDDDA